MKTTSPPCIVIDTNVLISAGLFPASRTAEALAVVIKHFEIAQNAETWRELETRIGKSKFDRYFASRKRSQYLLELARSFRYFPTLSHVAVSRDPDDDKFINLAIYADAKLIVSGDADLLTIGHYEGIRIVSLAEFLEQMQK